MPEMLNCLIKGCNNSNFKDLHLCRKHFYKFPKDIRESINAMKKVLDVGEITHQHYLFFVRKNCILLEPEVVVPDPKLVWNPMKSSLRIFDKKKGRSRKRRSVDSGPLG